MLQLEFGGRPGEECLVLGIGTRPTPLDPVDAQCVELAGHLQLVVWRHRDALELDTVAQRRVEDLHVAGPRRIA